MIDWSKVVTGDEKRAEKEGRAWSMIKRERERRKSGGVFVSGYWFHTDTDSRVQQLGLKDEGRDILDAGGTVSDTIVLNGSPVQWKTLSKDENGQPVFVPMTVQLAFDIVAAVKALDAAAFGNAEAHRLAMLQSQDPDSYDFSAGWPAIYEHAQ